MRTALAAAFVGGIISALFYLPVLFGGGLGALILGYLAPFPLLVAGLSLGSTAAAIGGAVGTVLVFAGSGSVLVAAAYAVTGALPAWVIARQALLGRPGPDGSIEWYPPGHLLMVLTGLGLAAFGAAVLLTLDQPDGLDGVVREALGRMSEEVLPGGGDPASGPEAFWMAAAIPGIVVISWLLMTIINAALAQGVLMRFGRNRRPAMRLSAVDLPPWLVVAFALSVTAAMVVPGTVGFLVLNVALILAVPFAFAGLSVVHAFARHRSARTPTLVGFYIFLVLFGWPIVLMVGLGVIEQWLGLRRRWAAAPAEEDE